jgi:hypothetical protein
MSNTIKIRNSGTSSNVPSALEYGELAINYSDGKLFYKDSSNNIVSLVSENAANIFASDTAPSSPAQKDLWFRTSSGQLFIRYDFHWVEIAMPDKSSATVSTNIGSAPFSPLDLSPVLWLDASDTSTITEVGGAVSQWDDKSGNGNNVTQGTAAAQPTSGTRTLNGLNVLDFTDDLLLGPVPTASVDNFTLVAVFHPDAITDLRAPVHNDNGYGIAHSASSLKLGWLQAGGGWRASSLDATTDPQIVVLRRTSGTASMRYNGTDVAGVIGSTPNVPTVGFKVGTHAGASYWDGTIAEIVFIDGVLSANELSDLESYLADKWGITI